MAEAASKVIHSVGAGTKKVDFDMTLARAEKLGEEQAAIAADVSEIWKEAKECGVHVPAARFVQRLRKMDDRSRNDFLRAFDVYRDWANLDRQVDMFDAPRPKAPPAEVPPEAPQSPPQERRGTLEDDTADLTAAILTPEEAREDGVQACRLEVDIVLNPHDPDNEPDQYEAWANGWHEAMNAGEWGADTIEPEPQPA